MNSQDALVAAVSATVADSEQDHRQLLQSVVDVARAILDARASSIMLLDPSTDELVFEAVSGEGEQVLVGRRFPAARGVAGFVLASGEPLIVDDTGASPLFAADIAASTAYLPGSLMAVPLLHRDEVLGVLEVLDRRPDRHRPLGDMDLLGLFARHAAAALAVIQHSREASRVLHSGGEDYADLVAVIRTFDALANGRRDAGLRLLGSLRDLLAGSH